MPVGPTQYRTQRQEGVFHMNSEGALSLVEAGPVGMKGTLTRHELTNLWKPSISHLGHRGRGGRVGALPAGLTDRANCG